MRYVDISAAGGNSYGYPDHNIDPAKKDMAWCMQYAKAAFYDWSFVYPKGVFANNGGDYEKFRMYALGKQPISQYKRLLGVDAQTDNTWMSVDWSVRAIVTPYRNKSLSRMMAKDYSIVATPIDMLAKSDLESYYADLRAKHAVRELLRQTNSELGNHPLITLQSGEPMDEEELEMRIELGEQFNRAKDAEMAIELGFYENGYKVFRRGLYEDLFDYGVAGYKEWLGTDNKAKFRKVFPENVIISYCKNKDFSDMVHAGEVIEVPLIELATITNKEGNKMFTEQQLQEFASTIAGKWGNPRALSVGSGILKPYDKFKCKVLDLSFFTYNDYVYRDGVDENGNADYRKAEYFRKSKKHTRKNIQCVYKVKWIVGTEYCYDWGMEEDQKRNVNIKKKAYTSLPYKFFAYNFYEMRAQGFMEGLIPFLDDYQLTMLKIQNFKNRAVPSGWWIDLDALENVALNKGGKNMEAKELLQMFYDTGVLLGRSKDAQGNPMSPNWKPVIPIENTAASELAMFYQDLITTIQAIERLTGYNDITSGDPNPKTLVPGYELAAQSTSDALAPMEFAEKWLCEKLAEDVLCRMQQGVKKGDITGYAPYGGALNKNILTFIKLSPTIALREYGIELEEKTTTEERIWLLTQMQEDIKNGFLNSSDAVMLVNTHNAKQAQSIWAYRVKKSKEQAAQQKLAELQTQNQGAIQAAQIAQQSALQQKQMEIDAELQKQQMAIDGEIQKEYIRQMGETEREKLKAGIQSAMTTESNITKMHVAQTAGQAKILAQHISSEGDKEKQEISNSKPKPTSK